MGRNEMIHEGERVKHYRTRERMSPCGGEEYAAGAYDEAFDGLGEDDFIIGDPGNGCAEAAVYAPHVRHYRLNLTTGPFVLARSGKLVMRVENPYAECVWAEVRINDLRCGRREPLWAGKCVLRKTIKLSPRQVGTVSFDAMIPAGFLLEACVRADGYVLPMLESEPANTCSQTLYKSAEFLSLESRCP